MNRTAYYTHLDGQHYRCEVIEETDIQVKVRISEAHAQELKLERDLWLPRSYLRVDNET